MKRLKLNAAKVGNLTIRELVTFAEHQGCELSLQFVRPPDDPHIRLTIDKTALVLANAIELDA